MGKGSLTVDEFKVLYGTFASVVFYAEEAVKKISLKLVEFSDPKFFMQFGKDEHH